MVEFKTHPKEYAKIHKWLKDNFGKADRCQSIECDKTSNNFQWAKKAECRHDYRRENYLMLCQKCHGKYDANEKGRKRSITIKENNNEKINNLKFKVIKEGSLELKQYSTVKDMPKYYPIFSESALRHIIHENRNGIQECIRRVGKRILFDLEKFQIWIDKQTIGG